MAAGVCLVIPSKQIVEESGEVRRLWHVTSAWEVEPGLSSGASEPLHSLCKWKGLSVVLGLPEPFPNPREAKESQFPNVEMPTICITLEFSRREAGSGV